MRRDATLFLSSYTGSLVLPWTKGMVGEGRNQKAHNNVSQTQSEKEWSGHWERALPAFWVDSSWLNPYSHNETLPHSVVHVDLEFAILLPQLPRCWYYRPVSLKLARMRHLKHISHSKAKRKATGLTYRTVRGHGTDDTLIFFVIKISVVVRIQQGFVLLRVTHMYQAGLQVYSAEWISGRAHGLLLDEV